MVAPATPLPLRSQPMRTSAASRSAPERFGGIEAAIEGEGIASDLIVCEITDVEINAGCFFAHLCGASTSSRERTNQSRANDVDIVEIKIECVCRDQNSTRATPGVVGVVNIAQIGVLITTDVVVIRGGDVLS